MVKLKRQLNQKSKFGMKNKLQINKSRKTSQHAKKKNNKVGAERNAHVNEEDDRFDVAPACLSDDLKQLPSLDKDGGDDVDTRKMVKNQNKKQKQSGGFQSMGLSFPVYKGIQKKGYKVPTPIQRKTIPLIMDGKDVVGMARTGSGKTGAFLIPMLEKLHVHSSQAVRAVILSPTRELALQTAKFTTELGKFTGLKSALIVGGDSIENQFASFHRNPDIVIATPGRLLHLLVEMNIKQLDAVEYVVFDEADRLFEMGFAEQLKEIIQRLPQSRQTVLFSATLPKVLVDFATAGLSDPTLVRLDIDTKISDKLKTSYILMRDEDKAACLLHMLQKVIKLAEQTVVFTSTKHHVDYLHQLLTSAGMTSTFIYSSLHQEARKVNLAKFRNKTSKILVVTDIAARGLDIPLLDNVINFDFPSRPKIFVHRVGRVARAGRSGNAYSFLVKDEVPYLIDLHLFLGKPLKYAGNLSKSDEDGMIGTLNQGVISNELDFIKSTSVTNFDLVAAHKVMKNGYKHYLRSRETASVESNKRAREIDLDSIFTHPLFCNTSLETNEELSKLLLDLRKFKPSLTVFESAISKKSKEAENVMQSKRKAHEVVIEREHLRQKDKVAVIPPNPVSSISDDKYIADSFNMQNKDYKDENYIPRQSSDSHQEKGLSLSSFEKEATSVSVELTGDDTNALRLSKANKKWDRKRKRFVGVESPHAKKFKTESGNYISASYKSNRYNDWMKKGNVNHSNESEHEGDSSNRKHTHGRFNQSRGRGVIKSSGRVLKSKEEIVKKRLKDEMMNSIRNKSKKGGKSSKTSGRNTSKSSNMHGRKGGGRTKGVGRGGGKRRGK